MNKNKFDNDLKSNRRYSKAANAYSRTGIQSLWAKMMWQSAYQFARARISHPEAF